MGQRSTTLVITRRFHLQNLNNSVEYLRSLGRLVPFDFLFQSFWLIVSYHFSDLASPISRSRSGAKTNTPAIYLYWTFDQAFYLCRIGTNTTALRSNSWAASNFRAQIRYRFILRTWFSLTTLRGLVRSQSCLVRQNWTKKRECSTGTTVNKNRNYIDNCFSHSPSLRL